ncbi:helix-turn-helix domain-containing protein [Paenibacillus sp. MER TA 81-3]|uniref:helix-turn-helix domain-containing protein n=1 Tax=Paenibacillus sp. MER TA 81-3 TaxID=2939573 RepID=UPI00203FE3EC|nr:helix-turn-helix transcriptional regulator [Paenibacillus sp. MER TA 81-3]MCM3341597.1 helix-turn-helix domain-containing protein [Paenibacillus sp. MER TA 81-3]
MLILGERIKASRISRGWTQEELAGKIDTTKHVISNWERNKGNPDPEQITALANTFEVSADYLLGLSNFPEPHFRDPFGQITLIPTIDYSFVKGSTWDLLKLLRSGISLTVDVNEISSKDKELIATVIEAILTRSSADA